MPSETDLKPEDLVVESFSNNAGHYVKIRHIPTFITASARSTSQRRAYNEAKAELAERLANLRNIR